MSNPNFLTANNSGLELMPGVNDEAQGYDVNRIVNALTGVNIVPITTGNLTVTGNETISGTLNVTGLTTLSGGVSLAGSLKLNPGPIDVIFNDSTVTNHYYDVYSTFLGSGTQTGTLKILFPTAAYKIATMLQIVIKGYEYSTISGALGRGPWQVMVGGYNYTDGNWYNYQARIIGNAPFNSVRLAQDGTSNCILLGTTSTQWNFATVVVSEVLATLQNTGFSIWGSGWTSALLTSETGITNIFTPTLDLYTGTGSGRVQATQGLDVGADISATGTIVSNSGGVVSQGSTAAIEWVDRTGTSPTAWLWYASGGLTHLWNNVNSDRITVDGSGNVTLTNSLTLATPGLLGTWTKYRCRAYMTGTAQVVNGVTNPIKFNSVSYDPNSNFNTSTWTYTVPVTGYYRVAVVLIGNLTSTAQRFRCWLNVNGAASENYDGAEILSAANGAPSTILADTIHFNSGDTITVGAFTSGAVTLLSTSFGSPTQADGGSHFSIEFAGT